MKRMQMLNTTLVRLKIGVHISIKAIYILNHGEVLQYASKLSLIQYQELQIVHTCVFNAQLYFT